MANDNKNIFQQLGVDVPGANIVTHLAESRIGIIQLSDLQFGKKHMFKDPKDLADRLVSDILEMSEKHKFKPYFLVLSGDIAEEAKEDEYKKAEELVSLLKDALSIDIKQILCVPGNHDIDWGRCTKLQEDEKFQPYNKFLEKIGCKDQCTQNVNYPFTKPTDMDHADLEHTKFDIEFALLNSCEKHDHQIEKHFPYICTRKLKTTLKSKDQKKCLRIAISHHPLNPSPLQPTYVIRKLRESDGDNIGEKIDAALNNSQEACDNASDVKDIIKSYEFDIILTGHTHQASFDSSFSTNTHMVILAGSGSVAVDKTELPDMTLNQYSIHVIDFDNSMFESYSRVLVPRQSKHGKGLWVKDNTPIDNPAVLDLSFLKEIEIEKRLEKEGRIVPEKALEIRGTDLGSDELADELAIFNLLGGWNE